MASHAQSNGTFSWTDLFATNGAPDFKLDVHVFRRAGHPLLILPRPPEMAADALSLYPAQTRFAKAAKQALLTALRARFPMPLNRASVYFSRKDPFPNFLASLAGMDSQNFPALAILAGNPRVIGRRFLVLLFDKESRPAYLVKAGIGDSARRLIQKESAFIQSAPPDLPGLPRFCGEFASERLEALALAYVNGDWPAGEDHRAVGDLLGSWVERTHKIHAADVPAWQALANTHSGEPLFSKISAKLACHSFHPALFHGDFTPWNVKVMHTNGSWIALDWERSERVGFPAWDWFHYVVQRGILVEKLGANGLIGRLDGLFHDPAFRLYTELAEIKGLERPLAAAYLFHCVHTLRPTEGIETAKSLLAMLGELYL